MRPQCAKTQLSDHRLKESYRIAFYDVLKSIFVTGQPPRTCCHSLTISYSVVTELLFGKLFGKSALSLRAALLMAVMWFENRFSILSHLIAVATTVATASIKAAICTVAATVGSLMPIVAKRIGVDPAVFSNPFITTVVDALGLVVYFLIARAVLGI